MDPNSTVKPGTGGKEEKKTKKGLGTEDGPASAPVDLPNTSSREAWQMEISFRPNQAIQTAVFGLTSEAPAKPWHFHKLERGVGPLMLDYQELRVSVPPKALDKPLTGEECQIFIRQNITEFLDPAYATAKPRTFDDRWRMLTRASTGGTLLFEFPQQNSKKSAYVISDQVPDRWALTAVYAGLPGYQENRLAGTRWIGIANQDKKGMFSIFTKAALRANAEPASDALQADVAVWASFLAKTKVWIESLGGSAEIKSHLKPVMEDWEALRHTHFTPLEKWKDIDGAWEVKETRDTKKRFRIEIHEGMGGATLIERSPNGVELNRNTRLSGAGPNTWVLERTQDPEVLDFLGVDAELAKQALATNPAPSTLTITRKGETLQAVWKGIMIQTNSSKQLDRIIFKSRPYELIPAAK